MSRFRTSHHEVPGLNTASLPDLIFTVLFFFMIEILICVPALLSSVACFRIFRSLSAGMFFSIRYAFLPFLVGIS